MPSPPPITRLRVVYTVPGMDRVRAQRLDDDRSREIIARTLNFLKQRLTAGADPR